VDKLAHIQSIWSVQIFWKRHHQLFLKQRLYIFQSGPEYASEDLLVLHHQNADIVSLLLIFTNVDCQFQVVSSEFTKYAHKRQYCIRQTNWSLPAEPTSVNVILSQLTIHL
jgi:hypothetical protein